MDEKLSPIAENSWSCLPAQETGNSYAIFFAIRDNFSFAVANVIMGLYTHSPALMAHCDILIYHEGVSEKHRSLLRRLHENTFFLEMTFPQEWDNLLNHQRTLRWGKYILCKTFGYFLIHRYERALFLDADMHILGDIQPLFELDTQMAWRSVISWDPRENFGALLKDPEDNIDACNSGLVLFSQGLKQYGLDIRSVVEAFETVKDVKHGGNCERILSWIAYDRGIQVTRLDGEEYNTPTSWMNSKTRLLHFLDCRKQTTKPWECIASYVYFTDWAEHDRRWQEMGGDSLICWTEQDRYGVLGFDRIIEIFDLKETLKEERRGAKALSKENARLKKQLEKQQSKLEKLEKQHSKLEKKYEKLEKQAEESRRKLEQIQNSRSWKLTAPLRRIIKALKRLKARIRNRIQSK